MIAVNIWMTNIGYSEKFLIPSLIYCCRVYNIGIEVRQGRGRYSGTNIVTFAPRYQLDNSSCHKLGFAQQYAVLSGEVSWLY